MSGGGSDDEDKQHEATPKKLEDARKKGEVPRSADLITTGTYAGILLVALSVGAGSLSAVGDTLAGVIGRAETLSLTAAREGGTAVLGGVMLEVGAALAPWAIVPFALALLSVIAQQAFVVTGSKLQPKLNRISILSNAKNKFGRNGLFEFAKSTAKLTIYSVVLGLLLWHRLPQMLAATALEPGLVAALFLRLAVEFMGIVLLISVALGSIDFFWQRAEHLRKNRMSHKEVMDEHKQSEGDPHMKQQRRQRGYDIAMNTMLADVPGANVVVTNPTHYAVALKWDRSSPGAPVCVAKGVDEIAARIREAAEEAGVPLHPDPPTARALHAAVEVGQEIRPEHYAAVAVAIRFAEGLRKKAKPV